MGTTEKIYRYAAKRALERAYEEGTHGHFAVIESDETGAEGVYRIGETVYLVTLAGCSCKAGQCHMLCKHVLSLADLTGKLDAYLPGCYAGEAAAARIAA